MKITKMMKMSPLALCALTFAVAEVSLVNVATAEPVVATAAAQPIVEVGVPVGGASVTYVLDGKTVEIKAGESAVIPSGATNVVLPAGTVVNIKSAPNAKVFKYSVNEDTTLENLTKSAVEANSNKFTLVEQQGQKKIHTFFNPATVAGTDSNL